MKIGAVIQRELPFGSRVRGAQTSLATAQARFISPELLETLPQAPVVFPNNIAITPQPYVERLLANIIPKVDFKYTPFLYKAFTLAWDEHAGKLRADKVTPYFDHVLSVAEIVADWIDDAEIIGAAFCHDLLEDTDVLKGDLENEFSARMADFVEAVSKFKSNEALTSEQIQIETIKKLIELSVNGDLGAILVKLADRLHNMRTLGHKSQAKQKVKAEETLYVYAPLAKALGMWEVSRELEDLAYQYIDKDNFARILEKREQIAGSMDQNTSDILKELKSLLHSVDPDIKANFEKRNIYELFLRMQRWNIKLEDLIGTDIFRLNVVTQTTAQCYLCQGRVFGKFSPLVNTGNELYAYHDYIAQSHPTGHRLIHAYVENVPYFGKLLVQIRSQEMWRSYRLGVFSKPTKVSGSQDQAKVFLGSLLAQFQEKIENTQELYDLVSSLSCGIQVKLDDGTEMTMPIGSSIIDLAKAVPEYDRLLFLIGAIVNGTRVDPEYRLKFGDVIKLLTDNAAKPRLRWLKAAKTPQALKVLRDYFAERNLPAVLAEAKTLLKEAAWEYYLTYDELTNSGLFVDYCKQHGKPLDELLVEIGQDKIKAEEVALAVRNLYLIEMRTPKYPTVPHFIAFSAKDRRGFISDLAQVYSELGFNISTTNILSRKDGRIYLLLGIDVFGEVNKDGFVESGGSIGKIQRRQIMNVVRHFSDEGSEIRSVSLKELVKYAKDLLSQYKDLLRSFKG